MINSARPLVLLCALVVAGCSGDSLSREFGFQRDAPDEFQVTTRAPLSMPPDLTLRPPQPGEVRPQEQTTSQRAQSALEPQAALGAVPGGADSPGQDALLHAAGPAAPADIRATVDADAAHAADNKQLTDMLMFWKTPTPPGVLVDSDKEAQRLRDNAALGQQPDSGDTPIIQRKSSGLLDSLF